MIKWVLFDFKTAKEPWFEELSALYLKKIKPYAAFEIQHLKTVKIDRDEAEVKRKFEEKVILEKLSSDDYVILLDEKGKKLDSLQFSKAIEKMTTSGKKRGVLIVGGAFGVSDAVKKRSELMICLSDMTMNHLVAEAMLLEQLFEFYCDILHLHM